ncbi:serine protein kinase [Clostridium cochlearium]|uniref:serine protein kinase n=2 Tax=Clostridium cochlearium TaxID=1494 RepID=UPI000B94EFEF|nr:serine protein kinase [Clostridium cochlearium]MBE6064153.1 serine protein kinase [Clostridium cochlearium]MBU5269350.1 serine protein kinase [Clostridium cochlearium]NMA58031.1 serine protein kinase [Clostridium cochlearium]SNV73555.1 prkA protein [Clostridium cochlearium]STA92207.1 prkA protein [Clostridium cochlearium]
MDLKELIEKERNCRKKKVVTHSFIDYLNIVKENPDVCKFAHKRIYDLIIKEGFNVIDKDKNIKKYNFFKEDFFGIDKSLMQIVNYFYSASMKGEESRQVLYLVGPVGSGKSSIVDAIKRALEENNTIYALENCPMREEPLHLIPKSLRRKFEKELDVKIEGDLCPVCNYRLREEFNGEIERFPVEEVDFSIREQIGIGVVPPVDPNNQDTSVLIGSVDISKMDIYPEDDPRIFSLNGAFNVGNRGIVEFIEIFKNDIEYLHSIITATQEKLIPCPGKAAMIYYDGVIIAHSNEGEWNKFKSDPTNEAILDRIVKIEIPYCLELDEEKKIYEKILKNSNFKIHIAPHTIDIAAMFAILTRLNPSEKVDLMTKLKIYNGEEIIEKASLKKVDREELEEECKEKEGMVGVSTRFIIKAINNAICQSNCNCINPIDVINSLIIAVKGKEFCEEDKDKYISFLQDIVRKEYNKILDKEITKIFIESFNSKGEALFNNYLDHAEAYVNKILLKDNITGETLEPDEEFMREIEEEIGVTKNSAKGFRKDVVAYVLYLIRKGEEINYKCYKPLKEAIERRLMSSSREIRRIVDPCKIRSGDQEEQYKFIIEKLKSNGYCEICASTVLRYAANNFWRD